MTHSPMTIVELLDRYPALFYGQTWYRANGGEMFTRALPNEAHFTPPTQRTHAGKMPNRFVKLPLAVEVLNAYVVNPTHEGWSNWYYWCRDRDGAGQQVYVGKGYDGKGLMEIHRRSEITSRFVVGSWR